METTYHLFESIHCVYSKKFCQNTNILATILLATQIPSNTQVFDGIWVANIKYRILLNTGKYYMGTSLKQSNCTQISCCVLCFLESFQSHQNEARDNRLAFSLFRTTILQSCCHPSFLENGTVQAQQS